MRMRPSSPAQWPIMIQASGRSTARQSVMVLALEGPTPMLIIVMPSPPAVIRSKRGIWYREVKVRPSTSRSTASLGWMVSPLGSTKAV